MTDQSDIKIQDVKMLDKSVEKFSVRILGVLSPYGYYLGKVITEE